MKDRVLVVDDDRTVRELVSGLLRGSYEVATAASGEEALAAAARHMPGLVILDIAMPGIDGHETCRRLKADFAGEPLQVIMLSARSSREEQLRAFEAGADAYLVKPFDPNVLLSEVRVHFRLHESVRRMASVEAEFRDHRDELARLMEEQSREVKATQDVAVFALAKVAESRDEGTGVHLVRVRAYSMILAEQLRHEGPYRSEIGERFLEELYRSSPLHDIGKVGIGDAILLKPGRLTPEEFAIVKVHTTLGANILQQVVVHSHCGGFLAMAESIARSHHERFDGKGYPEGLSARDIPLPARIVALADVFDALTSDRPYKRAYSPMVAANIISEESGKHFDPAIVTAFQVRFDEFLEILGNGGDAGAYRPADLLSAASLIETATPACSP